MNIPRTIIAGLIGGILIDAFLFATGAMPFPGAYQFIASTLIGPVAFTSTAYIAVGVVMHFTISIAFAFVYAFAATRYRELLTHPTLWGAVLGVGAMIVMQIVLAVAHAAKPPTAAAVIGGLIAHVVFFGLPVAWTLVLLGRQRGAGRHAAGA